MFLIRGPLAYSLIMMCAVLCGCIPSEPAAREAKPVTVPATVPVGDAAAPPAASVTPASPAAQPPGEAAPKLSLPIDDPGGANVGVEVLPLEDGKGYAFRGSFGLTGTITKPTPETEEWTLAGEFVFPSGGYSVGKAFYSPLGTMVLGNGAPTLQSSSEMVAVSIPIKQPAPGTDVTTALENVPVKLKIRADSDVKFVVVLISG